MVSRSRSRKSKKGSTEAKLLGALIAALLFFIVSEKHVYALTNMVFSKINKKLATANNCSSLGNAKNCTPTLFGEILHSVVFGLLVLLVMEI
jgi:glycerol uptake facilitator-like aquaporin